MILRTYCYSMEEKVGTYVTADTAAARAGADDADALLAWYPMSFEEDGKVCVGLLIETDSPAIWPSMELV